MGNARDSLFVIPFRGYIPTRFFLCCDFSRSSIIQHIFLPTVAFVKEFRRVAGFKVPCRIVWSRKVKVQSVSSVTYLFQQHN
jgi:hypothetical protein